ncbi:hypothetical protein PAECIP111893_02387 [Paenibacillus plantiphilus]|uniref:Uncharacterized protein n=1 Tax=Paenibacillus plantiphilus TaxID=2905650 RepID=A0ABM9C6L4_9BACL|nr:hypothetical protein [Paenibacillus plantiphilus]CAH1205655.1 hypothetical protein PAECIP111893_02387 [Paenibacillus plantiphilus]
MAFVWHQNSDSRQPKFITDITFTASTTFTYGQALIVSSTTGRWVTAAAGGPIGGVYNGPTITTPATPDVYPEIIEVRAGDEFTADYVGTPDATFKPGQSAADISSGGLTLNAADVTGGPCTILSLNTSKTQAVVRIKNRQFS